MSILKERLNEAIKNKENDINSFIWKGKKSFKGQNVIQESKKLVDCTIDELKKFYSYCETMLYNKNKFKPGRYILLENTREQREKCNAELFVRWLEKENNISRYSFMITLREFLNNNPKLYVNNQEIPTNKASISMIVNNTPSEFSNVKVELVMSACLDSLGLFDRHHITTTFLLKQGVYLTPEDNKARDKSIPKIEYIREYLDLYPEARITIDHRGLSLSEMRSMITLKSKKYSELTTKQLTLLRNRILFSLENDILYHINQWETRQNQIKKVATFKGFNI